MTCIVGIEDRGRVWIGGDSAAIETESLGLRIRGDPKVFSVRGVLFGFTHSFRMGQLLRFSLKIPRQAIKDDYRYLCTDFVNAVRECLTNGGCAQTNEGGAEQGGNFLIGYRGHLYNIDSDYQVGIPKIGLDACGCGGDYALGSLLTTAGRKLTPKKRILQALVVASYLSAGVSPPFSMVVSKKYTVKKTP